MSTYKAYSQNVEVNGETVLSVINGMGAFKSKAVQLLNTCGIADPQPGRWYNQQKWLDAFKLIAQSIGQNTLRMIGAKIPETAKFPPGIDSIEKALAVLDAAYRTNHRGGEIGQYRVEKTGDNEVVVISETPYPCEFDNGLIEAVARKFSKGLAVTVVHEVAGPCRKKGDKACRYTVKWR